jgi:hypothetical protein
MRYGLLLSLAIWASSVLARGQGSFQNLGFESATLVPDGSGRGDQFAPAFPGWSGYIGGVQQTVAAYNSVPLDSSGISIIDRGFTLFGQYGSLIEGNYSAVLSAGVVNGLTDPEDVTLSQTGLVPASAQSLWFKVQLNPSLGGFLQVTLGGEILSPVIMGFSTNYMVWAADVRSFAGQTAELDFTAHAQRPHGGNNYAFLDSIEFSGQVIPEPNVLGLLAVGAAVLSGVRIKYLHISNPNCTVTV